MTSDSDRRTTHTCWLDPDRATSTTSRSRPCSLSSIAQDSASARPSCRWHRSDRASTSSSTAMAMNSPKAPPHPGPRGLALPGIPARPRRQISGATPPDPAVAGLGSRKRPARIACTVGGSGHTRGMRRDLELEATIVGKYSAVAPVLDERSRRLWAAAESTAIGYGGDALVSSATGLARETIRKGRREIARGEPPTSRIRAPGAGRPGIEQDQPGVVAALTATSSSSTSTRRRTGSWPPGSR